MRHVLLLASLLAFASSPVYAQTFAEPSSSSAPLEGADSVTLVSGETLTGEFRLVPSYQYPRYALLNGERYELTQIRSFSTQRGNYAFVRTQALPRLLIVERSSGRLSIYQEAPGHFSTGADYVQGEDGQIALATSRYLRNVMVEHPEALRRLNYDRAYNALGYTGLAVGAGLMGAGIAIQSGMMESPVEMSGLHIALSGVAVAAAVNALVPTLQQSARRSAIRAYNR